MKKVIFIACLIFSQQNFATEMCEVEICNKLKRFSLSLWSHMKDAMGKTCWTMQMPKEMAVKGKELDSDSRWYQGKFNPTKRSVTWVESVGECHKLDFKPKPEKK